MNKSIAKEVLKALGKSRRETLEEKIKMLSDGINDNRAVPEDSSASQAEKNKARERAKRQIEERVDLKKESGQLKKGVYQHGQSITLQEFQQRDEVRQERVQEMQREREAQEEIKNDENRPSAEREHAREKIEELDLEKMKSKMKEKEKPNSFRCETGS